MLDECVKGKSTKADELRDRLDQIKDLSSQIKAKSFQLYHPGIDEATKTASQPKHDTFASEMLETFSVIRENLENTLSALDGFI